MQTPPPFVPPQPPRMHNGIKLLVLGLQCALLMIGALIIWIISYSRDSNSNRVAEEIARGWGEEVLIDGPTADSCRVYPESFVCEATVSTKSLHRNIYEAEVFNADVAISGTFVKDSLAASEPAVITLAVASPQIARLSPLTFGGREYRWRRTRTGLQAEVDIADMPQTIEFSTDFEIHGSGKFYVRQYGNSSSVTISGEAPNPSFSDSQLPTERSVEGRHFSASWRSFGLTEGRVGTDRPHYIGAKFLVGVDRYQKVSRSLKYAFIIIVLTYISVLFVEIMTKRNIPLLNYFLIGVALVLFYSLLLSFTDLLSFEIAYLIAATMTIALIVGYMWKMLGSKKATLAIGVILSMLYVSCFILLSMPTYSLLLGSLMLFVTLAAMMYGSLRMKTPV
ncbi:MAG: cell envelope integrity protein CreD [Muribaculaceae bacterium]|nr:cell envelope integrity protein CreD [Muribaculaceae bacterium]